jgi:uncharacterized protein (TIGR04168 family)
MSERPGSIAIVGDLHSDWDDRDVAYFNRADHELLLFTGDLGASNKQDGARIARSISRIQRNVLVMLGNNDAPYFSAIAAELTYQEGARSLLRASDRPSALPRARLCGYSSHTFPIGPEGITVIAGRPFSMGGPELTFGQALERELGVRSLAESAERIAALADEAPTRDLVFLSHNGPTGLGDGAESLWGRDFQEPAIDWGDADLAQAIARVRARGQHRVLAVIAGHMHSPTRGRREREVSVARDGTLYINPARVPRIFEHESGQLAHHYVELGWQGGELTATARLFFTDE